MPNSGCAAGIIAPTALERLVVFLCLIGGALVLAGLGYDLATLLVLVIVFLLLGPAAVGRLVGR